MLVMGFHASLQLRDNLFELQLDLLGDSLQIRVLHSSGETLLISNKVNRNDHASGYCAHDSLNLTQENAK